MTSGEFLIHELREDFPKYTEFYGVKGVYFYIKAANRNFPAYIVSDKTSAKFDFFINFVELDNKDQ